MSGLSRFEQRLESMISGAFAKAFRSAVQPVEIAAGLQREVDNKAQIVSRSRRLVPNHFTIELSQVDLDRLAPYDNALERELAEQLEEHADHQGYAFPGEVKINFEEAEDLTTGRFRIRSRAQASVTGRDPHWVAERAKSRRTKAYLEINGSRHPLLPPGVVIGRGTEADIRINDPGVSRRHAEIIVATGQSDDHSVDLIVADLGSTNGILVNGEPVDRARVTSGSQITVGHTIITVHLAGEDLYPSSGQPGESG